MNSPNHISSRHSTLSKINRVQKLRHEIVIKMIDGETFGGRIFAGFNERPLDVINDDREFIPIELANNHIVIIAKKAIMMIDAMDRTSSNSEKFNDNIKDSSLLNPQMPPSSKAGYKRKSGRKHFDELENYVSDSFIKQRMAAQSTSDQQEEEKKQEYNEIVNVLNSSLFALKRSQDKEFDNKISNLINQIKNK